MASKNPLVGVLMGSDSDWQVMERCVNQLKDFGIGCEVRVLSAHRTPDEVHEYASSARRRGLKVLIAGAGMSAALAGVLASKTTLPVIGVPMASGMPSGLDAALSTMQMPPGVPVACMAIGPAGATNAAILAAQILALADATLAGRLEKFKAAQAKKVLEKDAELQKKLSR
ncbi:MAG: 5-(carboxyamino)imidazole ribonucleotide mutase [Planctomycetes bacterium]|nr:5-(carboxyamino)imidazole ribonucleotide mutase [Planctomycetota bacterium]